MQLTAITQTQDLAERLSLGTEAVEHCLNAFSADSHAFMDALLSLVNDQEDALAQHALADEELRQREEESRNYPF